MNKFFAILILIMWIPVNVLCQDQVKYSKMESQKFPYEKIKQIKFLDNELFFAGLNHDIVEVIVVDEYLENSKVIYKGFNNDELEICDINPSKRELLVIKDNQLKSIQLDSGLEQVLLSGSEISTGSFLGNKGFVVGFWNQIEVHVGSEQYQIKGNYWILSSNLVNSVLLAFQLEDLWRAYIIEWFYREGRVDTLVGEIDSENMAYISTGNIIVNDRSFDDDPLIFASSQSSINLVKLYPELHGRVQSFRGGILFNPSDSMIYINSSNSNEIFLLNLKTVEKSRQYQIKTGYKFY